MQLIERKGEQKNILEQLSQIQSNEVVLFCIFFLQFFFFFSSLISSIFLLQPIWMHRTHETHWRNEPHYFVSLFIVLAIFHFAKQSTIKSFQINFACEWNVTFLYIVLLFFSLSLFFCPGEQGEQHNRKKWKKKKSTDKLHLKW